MDWQPIETAPKDGTCVDLWSRPYTGKAMRLTDMWWSGSFWREGTRNAFKEDMAKRATHWMHIPEPPK